MTESTCPHCEDQPGWQPVVETKGTRRRITRCVCWHAAQAQATLARAGIPSKYRHATFDTFVAYNDSLDHARRVAQSWAQSYPEIPRRLGDSAGRGLVLSGPAGVGKTHLAAVLLKHVITHGGCRSGLFYTTKDLLWQIRRSYNPTIQATEPDVLQPIMTCDVLVLDDLGEERVTEWVAETMSLIVNTRYNACRPIICTTNYADLDDPENWKGLLCRVGFRIQSRLREMCEFIEVDGASYRDLPPNGDEADLRRLAGLPRQPALDHTRPQSRRPPAPAAHDGKAHLPYPGGRAGNT